jgi:hypothetical protein
MAGVTIAFNIICNAAGFENETAVSATFKPNLHGIKFTRARFKLIGSIFSPFRIAQAFLRE